MALRQIPDSDTLREAFDTTYDNDKSVEQQLGSKAAQNHTHEGYAPTGHTHDYAASAHSHANYQALLETNLDLLMRGLLYTKASPFSQSFTFSGDGTKTAFKIPRADVQQQGWVRGGVTATVDGASVSGTWNIHTQTYTLSSAPASGASVVVSSTDVVPYQGMATTTDTVELVRTDERLLIVSSGTGASTTHTNPYLPVSVKMPVPDAAATDDALFNDTPNAQGHLTNTGLMRVLETFYQSGNQFPWGVGQRRTLTLRTSQTARCKVGVNSDSVFPEPWHRGTNLLATIPHMNYFVGLMRVSGVATGSALQAGELVLGIGGSYQSGVSTLTIMNTNNSFDLFRLSGGPILEAA